MVGGAPWTDDVTVGELDEKYRNSDGFLHITLEAPSITKADSGSCSKSGAEVVADKAKHQEQVSDKDADTRIRNIHLEGAGGTSGGFEHTPKPACGNTQASSSSRGFAFRAEAPAFVPGLNSWGGCAIMADETDAKRRRISRQNLPQQSLPPLIEDVSFQDPQSDIRVSSTVSEPHRSSLQKLNAPTIDKAQAEQLADVDTLAKPQRAPATLQPEDHLKASLMGSRTHSLWCTRADSSQAHTKILQVCTESGKILEQHRHKFDDYPKMSKPRGRDQQCARNEIRCKLESITQTVQSNVMMATTMLSEPGEALLRAQTTQLDRIDNAVIMLQHLRAKAVEEHQKCEQDHEAQRRHCEAAIAALKVPLNSVDTFVNLLSQEVAEETAQAIQVHTETLKNLQQEQIRFINANESPQMNPMFAKLIDDIATTQNVLEEHEGQKSAYETFLREWQRALKEMPDCRDECVPNPRKRTFWSRVLGRA
jgi:hypothetical protein